MSSKSTAQGCRGADTNSNAMAIPYDELSEEEKDQWDAHGMG